MFLFEELRVSCALLNLRGLLRRLFSHHRLDARLERDLRRIVHRLNTLLELVGIVRLWHVSGNCLAWAGLHLVLLEINIAERLRGVGSFRNIGSRWPSSKIQILRRIQIAAPDYALHAFQASALIFNTKQLLVVGLNVDTFIWLRKLLIFD